MSTIENSILRLLALHICIGNLSWWYAPRTGQTVSRKAFKIELATDFRIGPARMRNIVRVKWHHMCEHFIGIIIVCKM